jgi:nucleoside-diphosphate-sugar epimerase
MTTLITGIGLIGTAFAKLALDRGERVVFVDSEPREDYLRQKLGDASFDVVRCDVRDLPALVSAMQTREVETVVHTAGLIGGRVANPLYTGLQVNILGTMNVCEAVRLTGVKRMVHVSTFGVYDRMQMSEKPIAESFPLGGTGAYPASKVANELNVNVYADTYGFELIILRPANVYGVGHFWAGSGGGENMQRLVGAGVRGEKLQMAPIRDFEYIYAKDIGRAVDLAATVPMPEQRAFNVGNGEITTFAELMEAAKTAMPSLEVEVPETGDAPAGIRSPMDLGASKRYLGWEPQYSLVEGLVDYAEDFRASLGL